MPTTARITRTDTARPIAERINDTAAFEQTLRAYVQQGVITRAEQEHALREAFEARREQYEAQAKLPKQFSSDDEAEHMHNMIDLIAYAESVARRRRLEGRSLEVAQYLFAQARVQALRDWANALANEANKDGRMLKRVYYDAGIWQAADDALPPVVGTPRWYMPKPAKPKREPAPRKRRLTAEQRAQQVQQHVRQAINMRLRHAPIRDKKQILNALYAAVLDPTLKPLLVSRTACKENLDVVLADMQRARQVKMNMHTYSDGRGMRITAGAKLPIEDDEWATLYLPFLKAFPDY